MERSDKNLLTVVFLNSLFLINSLPALSTSYKNSFHTRGNIYSLWHGLWDTRESLPSLPLLLTLKNLQKNCIPAIYTFHSLIRTDQPKWPISSQTKRFFYVMHNLKREKNLGSELWLKVQQKCAEKPGESKELQGQKQKIEFWNPLP